MFIYINYAPDCIKGIPALIFEIATSYCFIYHTQGVTADTHWPDTNHAYGFSPQ